MPDLDDDVIVDRDTGEVYDAHDEAEPAPVAPVAVEPATDEQVEAWDGWPLTTHRSSMVIARLRQEQAWRIRSQDEAVDAALREAAMGENLRSAERERDEAVAHAEAAEAALARSVQVTALERAVIDVAGKWYAGPHIHDAGYLGDLCNAVRALRDAQEAGH